PVITRRSVTQVPAPPPMSRGAILWGGENLLRPGWPRRCFPAGWKRHFFGGLFVRHGHVLIFIRRDQPGHGQSGLVPEEWPLTGSRKSRNQ
ncbi:portal protein, partial [Escherichia coli]